MFVLQRKITLLVLIFKALVYLRTCLRMYAPLSHRAVCMGGSFLPSAPLGRAVMPMWKVRKKGETERFSSLKLIWKRKTVLLPTQLKKGGGCPCVLSDRSRSVFGCLLCLCQGLRSRERRQSGWENSPLNVSWSFGAVTWGQSHKEWCTRNCCSWSRNCLEYHCFCNTFVIWFWGLFRSQCWMV